MHKGLYCILAVLAALVCASAARSATPRTWELREGGRWQEVNRPTTQQVREETLDCVEQLLGGGQASDAKDLVVDWLNARKESAVRDRGLYLLGECNYRLGKRIRAFYNFDELLDFFPASPYYVAGLKRQYDIADAYLSGYKDKFLGLAILTAKDEAVEMLYRIQQRSPGSPLAEQALLRTANYYADNGDADLAADAYAAYARTYPRSPNVPRVKMKQAVATLQQARGTRFDATPLIDARQQLMDLAANYPELARSENVSALMESIDGQMAIKMFQTAAFYRRTHEPKAAAFYYWYIMDHMPQSPEAVKSKQELANLPPDVRERPKAPATRRAVNRPATQPS